MALIDFGTDRWIRDFESCETLHLKILNELSDRDTLLSNTVKYDSLSGTIRVHLKQLETELNQLQSNLDSASFITYEEKERRQRLIEDLNRKKSQLMNMYSSRISYQPTQQNWSADDDDVPLLGETSIQSLKERQAELLSEQDKGLDRLSNIISRQKNIVITIGNEVNSQNEIIDDIGTRMESTNVQIHSEGRSVQGNLTWESYRQFYQC
ncbi:syntaxin-8 isoform X2 [Cimex lectularius]|uniref:t-SNARE coiled-coil homology domain-containing protein n=1 Tax=Cimex lectularius TaxID=79782 RepID=A0A8I6TGL2_CIMLE|nr:syntaxin-8 isoform X2 [Cimex lectularius]